MVNNINNHIRITRIYTTTTTTIIIIITTENVSDSIINIIVSSWPFWIILTYITMTCSTIVAQSQNANNSCRSQGTELFMWVDAFLLRLIATFISSITTTIIHVIM